MKKCSKCGERKELSEFYKSNGKHKYGVMAWCKECQCKNSKIIHKNGGRNRYLMRAYSISEEEYIRMKNQQRGRCEICGNKTDKLYVDHNHTSNKVRGLLCTNCNSAIGMLKEDISILNNAKKYLEKYE